MVFPGNTRRGRGLGGKRNIDQGHVIHIQDLIRVDYELYVRGDSSTITT